MLRAVKPLGSDRSSPGAPHRCACPRSFRLGFYHKLPLTITEFPSSSQQYSNTGEKLPSATLGVAPHRNIPDQFAVTDKVAFHNVLCSRHEWGLTYRFCGRLPGNASRNPILLEVVL